MSTFGRCVRRLSGRDDILRLCGANGLVLGLYLDKMHLFWFKRSTWNAWSIFSVFLVFLLVFLACFLINWQKWHCEQGVVGQNMQKHKNLHILKNCQGAQFA